MNFGNILGYVLQLTIPTVLAIETVQGQAVSGTDKKTMALTALGFATQAALSIFPAGSDNANAAAAAATAAAAAIDAAVKITRANGQYQAASALAVAPPAPVAQ